jgi:CheY-like chemotaxis protein
MNPDVVVSDVMMPVMDGYIFCEQMKKDKRTSHIPVILLTAKAMHKDKINGLQLGADDYIQKPFHLDELKLRIRYHLELRKKIQEEFLRNFRISSEIEEALSVEDKLLKEVFSHIEEHLYDEQFGVEKLSKLAGMSRRHLNNKIKSLTSQTANELIRNFRLRKAAHLLSDKGLTVSEACYQAGFNNLSYFSKCFTEFYGTRPSAYCK